jgi:hypothetical protein
MLLVRWAAALWGGGELVAELQTAEFEGTKLEVGAITGFA